MSSWAPFINAFVRKCDERIKEIDKEIEEEQRRRELKEGSIDVEYRRIE